MNPFTRSAISAAEHRLTQSRHEARDHYRGVRSALRARLGQPLFLLVVAGAGALVGIWLARRGKPRLAPEADAAPPPRPNMMSAFFIRFGMQKLVDTWMHLRATGPHHPSATNP